MQAAEVGDSGRTPGHLGTEPGQSLQCTRRDEMLLEGKASHCTPLWLLPTPRPALEGCSKDPVFPDPSTHPTAGLASGQSHRVRLAPAHYSRPSGPLCGLSEYLVRKLVGLGFLPLLP